VTRVELTTARTKNDAISDVFFPVWQNCISVQRQTIPECMPVGRAKCVITYSRDTNRTEEDAITELNIKDGKHSHCWDISLHASYSITRWCEWKRNGSL